MVYVFVVVGCVLVLEIVVSGSESRLMAVKGRVVVVVVVVVLVLVVLVGELLNQREWGVLTFLVSEEKTE